jgi:septum formation topological specificity factor MinE
MTPPTYSWQTRLLLLFYSNGNIAGCALALLGPALLFLGLIKSLWLPITAGLYLGGYFLAGRPKASQRMIEDSLTLDEISRRLDIVVTQARSHLTPEMVTSLESVRGSIEEVLPRLVGSDNQDLFTVKETVLRYLPETLANYIELPPVFRSTRTIKDGKTAKQLLGEQLQVLDDKMREVVANVAASDAMALVSNGKFLEAKFKQPDFLAAA